MDCYLVLRQGDRPVDEQLLRRFGVLTFYRDVLSVMVHVFEGNGLGAGRPEWLLRDMMTPICRQGGVWRKVRRLFALVRFFADEVVFVPCFSLYSRIWWDRKG